MVGKAFGSTAANWEDLMTVTALLTGASTFDGWYENGVKVSGAGAIYSFDVYAGRNLRARFIKTYKITAAAGAGGPVTGGGTFHVGSNVTLTALPDTAHAFDG